MDREPHQHEEHKSYLISQSSFESNLEEFLRSLDEVEDDANLWEPQLHNDVVFELPFADKTHLPACVTGKADCLEYIREWYNLFADFKIYDVKVSRMEEQGSYLLQYKTRGFVAATARPYNQDNIALVKVKDHKIIHIREYWNPIRLLEAFDADFTFQSNINFLDVKSIDPF